LQSSQGSPGLLAVWGLYGGQYAKLFEPSFNEVASWVCIAALVVGFLIRLFARS
jgi:hypothetical protein